jgi:hypothetical protein
MKNYLLRKSVREDLAERGVSYSELQAERKAAAAEARAAKDPEREARQARAAERREELRGKLAEAKEAKQAAKDAQTAQWKNASSRAQFIYLGVAVADDTIYKLGPFGNKTGVLGPLAGATAEVTDGTSRHTLTRLVTVVGALSKKTDAMAFVMTRDGELHQHKLEGAGQVRQAQGQAIKFNALVQKIEATQAGP